MSQESADKLRERLDYLTTVKRKEIVESIKNALSQGDDDSSEYTEAFTSQANVEREIRELEGTLAKIKIIDINDVSTDTVSMGLAVIVKDLDYDEEMSFIICSSIEAVPDEGRISNESPIGRALLGAKVDDIREVSIPAGIMRLQIVRIEKPQ
jgi:transcription elongation factor GreA